MMTTLATLRREAGRLGCTVRVHRDREGLEHEVLIDAPDGHVIGDLHQLVQRGDDGTPLEELYGDALERLRVGVKPCDLEDCDVCDDTSK